MANWSKKSNSQIEFDAEARGYARGRAEILAKVQALPSPLNTTSRSGIGHCEWCHHAWMLKTEREWHAVGCLWAEAHAETQED